MSLSQRKRTTSTQRSATPAYAFVFDFDLTLTNIHSEGLPDPTFPYILHPSTKKQLQDSLVALSQFGPLFIITRGVKDKVVEYLTEAFQEMGGFPIPASNIFGAKDVHQVDQDNWHIKKVNFLQQQIHKKLPHLDKKHIVFMDDDEEIVKAVKDAGYSAYLIPTKSTTGPVRIAYTLFILRHILKNLNEEKDLPLPQQLKQQQHQRRFRISKNSLRHTLSTELPELPIQIRDTLLDHFGDKQKTSSQIDSEYYDVWYHCFGNIVKGLPFYSRVIKAITTSSSSRLDNHILFLKLIGFTVQNVRHITRQYSQKEVEDIITKLTNKGIRFFMSKTRPQGQSDRKVLRDVFTFVFRDGPQRAKKIVDEVEHSDRTWGEIEIMYSETKKRRRPQIEGSYPQQQALLISLGVDPPSMHRRQLQRLVKMLRSVREDGKQKQKRRYFQQLNDDFFDYVRTIMGWSDTKIIDFIETVYGILNPSDIDDVLLGFVQDSPIKTKTDVLKFLAHKWNSDISYIHNYKAFLSSLPPPLESQGGGQQQQRLKSLLLSLGLPEVVASKPLKFLQEYPGILTEYQTQRKKQQNQKKEPKKVFYKVLLRAIRRKNGIVEPTKGGGGGG